MMSPAASAHFFACIFMVRVRENCHHKYIVDKISDVPASNAAAIKKSVDMVIKTELKSNSSANLHRNSKLMSNFAKFFINKV